MLTGMADQDLPGRPSIQQLPGRYVKMIAAMGEQFYHDDQRNYFELTCASCQKAGRYDLATVCVKSPMPDTQELSNTFSLGQAEGRDTLQPNSKAKLQLWPDYLQCMGYFHCAHCHAAGPWLVSPRTNSMLMLGAMAGMLENRLTAQGVEGLNPNLHFHIGKLLIDNGFEPSLGTDAEAYYLDKLGDAPEDAWLWNRLGNTYLKGHRPELAIVAYEHSLRFDANQMESHYSIGMLLYEVGAYAEAIPHLQDALALANGYKQLSPQLLRAFLMEVVRMLDECADQVDQDFTLLLPADDDEAAKKGEPWAMPLREELIAEFEEADSDEECGELYIYLAETYMSSEVAQLVNPVVAVFADRYGIPIKQRSSKKPVSQATKKKKSKRKKKSR
ncbi:hypothetical protein EDD73_10780 [Heliophilum fasciatum]|uniref:Uncharacterized protein n=1 Tax=Heliophilum fasciatum TaxID=35700 RepID=A0A4R2RPM8_9FIRM|nr:hypothetical protein EDD73_10780 [Heliophilum fasciatum]